MEVSILTEFVDHAITSLFFINLPVFIQTPKGTTFFLETQPSYTIGLIKLMIKDKKGVPTDELKLKCANIDQLLEDDHCTLSGYNIQNGSTVIFNYRTGKDSMAVQILSIITLLFRLLIFANTGK